MRSVRLLFGITMCLAYGLTMFAGRGSVRLRAADSSVPVGELLSFVAVPPSDGDFSYRFSVANPNGEIQVVRDYGRLATLEWTSLEEGEHAILVSARNNETGETTDASTIVRLLSRVASQDATVNPTHHPLIFLYSAPPCAEGAEVRVEFQSADGGEPTLTPAKPCRAGSSVNFWLAGLREAASYTARHIVAGEPAGAILPFETGVNSSFPFFPQTPVGGPSRQPAYRYIVHSSLAQPASATDLDGNLVWYYQGSLTSLTRVEDGGRMWGFVQDLNGPPENQIIREFDVAGVTLRETDAAQVNSQLKSRGLRPITGFHHEVRSLPGGKILALASSEQILTDVQGPGDVDVIGDTILVMDSNLQVEWVWDSFDHLDVNRPSTLPHVCENQSAGCPPFFLLPKANDWTHGNAVALTPDGHLLLSLRHMDWLIKIDYAHGQGSGKVLWRLGHEGDFRPVSDDPSPWFSHQHDGMILDDGRLLVFDNGNVRYESDNTTRSRGQVWRLDEDARTATLELNADLGAYSFALGSAQALDSGYHWGVGIVRLRAFGVETSAQGESTFEIHTPMPVYRSYRLRDLYTKP